MKSIFAKYITVFASVLLVSFLMLTSVISTTLSNYYDLQAAEEAKKMADMVSRLISMDWEEEEEPMRDPAGFNELLQNIGATFAENMYVVVTDAKGDIVARSDHGKTNMKVTRIKSGEVESLLSSENGTYEGVTSLDNVLDRKYQVYGYGIFRGEEPVGIVFACSNGAESSALFRVMNRSVVMSSLWVMLAALVVVYFVTERLVRPIKSMSSAAKKFAKGNFDERVQVTGKDEIAELAETFNQMADALMQQETMRNSFLANVSHDLRTPMTSIAGFVDNIRCGAIPPEDQPKYLETISTEIHRLSRLVSQILDISRLGSGERKFSFVSCDLCETARLVLISFEQKIDAKKLEVEFDAEEDSMLALADKDALHQVIYNLCENAIKFSKEGGKFRISIRSGEKHTLVCQVYNEGSGIPEEDLPHVFERFYKSDKSRGLDKMGVGLGLYIVKSIVDAHGGSISVSSKEGEDCCFTVVLRAYE